LGGNVVAEVGLQLMETVLPASYSLWPEEKHCNRTDRVTGLEWHFIQNKTWLKLFVCPTGSFTA